MMLLRRRQHLEPLLITTSPAPRLGEHVDVVADAGSIKPGVYKPGPDGLVPVEPPPAPRTSTRDVDDEPPPFGEGAQPGPTPPGYEPGVCHHPGHIMWNGLRFGVTPETADHIPNRATLTRCHHARADRLVTR